MARPVSFGFRWPRFTPCTWLTTLRREDLIERAGVLSAAKLSEIDDARSAAGRRTEWTPAAAARRVADFLGLGVPQASFDAVYALTCLLHVPTPDLPRVLEAISEVLVPGGLFYAGTWGGADEEGPVQDDRHPVPRFFAFRSDRRMMQALAERFHVLSLPSACPPGSARSGPTRPHHGRHRTPSSQREDNSQS
ncbi:MAG TPA: class I SAM-dependent methyltransferase [Streptosporangiaceae bacterium]|nr:class I SAM-dependent methyltransferase [Streptosporangiaceae bacterium]